MITFALSNSTVRADLGRGGYYVSSVSLTSNVTFSGDYVVSFYQINGIGTLDAYVNATSGKVVASQEGTRTSSVACADNGACLTDPWGGPKLSVIQTQVFVNINYVGSWTLQVVCYNKTQPVPSEPVFTYV
jgi:hypothetical protein